MSSVTELFDLFDPMVGFLKRAVPPLLLSAASRAAFSEECASFRFQSADTRSTASTFFGAGTNVSVSNLFESIDTAILPSFCRIELKITTNTTANSTALAEVWLPEDWNGRFLAIGNGGFSGGGNRRLKFSKL